MIRKRPELQWLMVFFARNRSVLQDSWLEGWLSIPSKQNIRRHGWRKQYVVVSSKKIFFYNSEVEKQNADPILILDLNKVFHVRSVTQGDVIRADAKDIPRILQILYAGEGNVLRSNLMRRVDWLLVQPDVPFRHVTIPSHTTSIHWAFNY